MTERFGPPASGRSSFIMFPKSATWELLKVRSLRGGRYSSLEALVSLALLYDARKAVPAIKEGERLWGWTRPRVRSFIARYGPDLQAVHDDHPSNRPLDRPRVGKPNRPPNEAAVIESPKSDRPPSNSQYRPPERPAGRSLSRRLISKTSIQDESGVPAATTASSASADDLEAQELLARVRDGARQDGNRFMRAQDAKLREGLACLLQDHPPERLERAVDLVFEAPDPPRAPATILARIGQEAKNLAHAGVGRRVEPATREPDPNWPRGENPCIAGTYGQGNP